MLCHRHIVVSGWFVRYYDLFLKYRDEICELFTLDAQITAPVKARMSEVENVQTSNLRLRLGVHIRRGDYKEWRDGQYYFDDETYARHVNRFAAMYPERNVHVYLSTNDGMVTEERFQQLCPQVHIHHLQGSAPEDLFMLSECDYLMGPPSTFSLVAQMYRDIPLYRMDTADEQAMTMEGFRLFDYWFRNMV